MNKDTKTILTAVFFIIILLGIYFANDIINKPDKPEPIVTFSNSAVPSNVILTNNLSVICIAGYSSTVRTVSESLRKTVFFRDNVSYPQPTGTTEVDHIIPLCLGGSNNIDNLFVQFTPEYKDKDKLEDYLCHHVCSGDIEINYAQYRMFTNWSSYYQEIYTNA